MIGNLRGTNDDAAVDGLLATCLETWAARFGDIPDAHLADIAAYIKEIEAIPDLFDGLDGDSLRQFARDVLDAGGSPSTAVDGFARAHLDYLTQWRDALDQLDAALRDARGYLPAWAEPITCGVARDPFEADWALKAAVVDYHHGSAGPYLNPAYGFEYSLSNGTAGPFRRP